MSKIQYNILKITFFLVLVMAIISAITNIYFQFQYSVDILIALQNFLTIAGILGFMYYSSQLLFKKVDFSSRTSLTVALVISSLFYLNYLYTIIVGVIPPLYQAPAERFLLTLGILYSIYAVLATYYFVCTWMAFFKIVKNR